MALVIEDGTGVAEANSYVTAEQIIAYAAERGVEILPGEAVDTLAIRAADYMSTLCYIGEVAYPGEQYMNWPRRGIIAGDLAEDAELVIPHAVVKGQLQLALDVFNGIDLMPSRKAEPKLKKRKTGPIEREYFEGSDYMPDIPFASAILRPVMCGDGFKLRTYRA